MFHEQRPKPHTCIVEGFGALEMHLSTRTHARARTHTHTHTHTHTNTDTHERTHARMHARTHARTHAHTHRHTHTHWSCRFFFTHSDYLFWLFLCLLLLLHLCAVYVRIDNVYSHNGMKKVFWILTLAYKKEKKRKSQWPRFCSNCLVKWQSLFRSVRRSFWTRYPSQRPNSPPFNHS